MIKKNKKELLNFLIFLVGIFIISITFNVFVVPNNYMIGGLSGISVLFNYLFNIDVIYVLVLGNILLILISVFTLGVKETTPHLVGSLIYTSVVYLTENINNLLNIHITSIFLNVVIIGVLLGIGYTCCYLAGYSTGGTDILGVIFKKRFGMPLGEALFILNLVILTTSTVVLGFEMLVISLLIRFIESRMIDSFLIGISDSKVMFIRSKKNREIKEYIIKEIKSGISDIKVTTGYERKEGDLIMCVIPTEKYMKLKTKIISIDKEAFITILDAYEVYGGTNRYKLPLHDMRI